MADFSQIISQRLAVVSPFPKFESKFITNPQNSQMGVLVIYVYEGLDPPYVCNGTVYLRNGSSKQPIKSERIEIDNLVHKRERFFKKHKEFCDNDLIDENIKIPFVSIYLYNPYTDIDINNLTENLRFMKKTLNDAGHWQRLNYSSESVLCFNTDEISKNVVTTITEFFVDGNVKISCPLFGTQKDTHEEWAYFLKKHNPNINVREMLIIDGYISYWSINNALQNAFKYINKFDNHIKDYLVSFEYKNIRNSVLYFKDKNDSNEEKKQHLQRELHVCPKNEVKIPSSKFIEDIKLENIENIVSQILETDFALVFGMDPDELRQRINEVQPLYPNGNYRHHVKNWD